MTTVGERIKAERKKKGWSQAKLGKELGVTQQMIAQFENSKKTPKHETLERIAEALCVPTVSLLGFEDNLHIPDIGSAIYDFSNEETRKVIDMLSDYKKLNEKGRQKAVEYTNDLTRIEEYTKKEEE